MAEIAAEYESSLGRSLAGCAEYMRFAVKGAKQQEEPEITDEDHDAVNVMTIHSAKGLEYPVVALGGAEGVPKGPPSIDISLRYGVTAKKIPEFLTGPSRKEVLTASWHWHEEGESEALAEEEERFWYVAATRARDKLIVCGLLKISGSSGEEVRPGRLGMIREAEKETMDGYAVCLLRIKLPHLLLMGSGTPDETARMLLPKTVSPAKLMLSASPTRWVWVPLPTGSLTDRKGVQWTAGPEKVQEIGVRKPCPLGALKWDFSPGRSTVAAGRGGADGKGYEKSALRGSGGIGSRLQGTR